MIIKNISLFSGAIFTQNSFLFNLFILDNWIWLNDLRFEFLKNGLILILSRIIYLILITFLVVVLSALRILFQFSFFLGVYCCSLSITNLHYILRANIIVLGFKLRHCNYLIRSLFLLIKIKIVLSIYVWQVLLSCKCLLHEVTVKFNWDSSSWFYVSALILVII
jgi:hypothetical protein